MKPFGCISLMSAPAAKAFSLPVIRMQPILSSASRSSTAAAISRNTPNDSALSIFGRFSVMTPTAPLLSTMMCSNVLMIHPGQPDLAGNVPAGGMGFKWASDASRIARVCRRPLSGTAASRHAMNMRAAEAIVSSAPNAMKIFPISEVWSQVVLSRSPERVRRT